MTLSVAHEEFSDLWVDWNSLLSRDSTHRIFQTPLWHQIWWAELGNQDQLRLTSLRSDGALVGIAPLTFHDNTLTFLGDTDLWDYHDFVVDAHSAVEFYPILFDFLRTQPWASIDLRSLPEGSSALTHLPNLARENGYATQITLEDVSPGLVLPSSWDTYLETLSKKDRHELRRKFRRLEGQEAYTCYAIDDVSSLQEALDDFFVLMRGSRQDKSIFLTPEREKFFRSMARELALQGMLKLFFLEISGNRVASALTFDYGDTIFLYNSGYNTQYSSLSVGLILKATCLRHAIETGKRYFDFLRGNEPYKYHLGAVDLNLYRLTIQR